MRLVALALVLAACAHLRERGSPRVDEAPVEGHLFRIQYWPGDEAAARRVRAALAAAAPRASRWGRLSVPVLITIHPDHQALEAAASREGHPWLRAWARFASIELQSPRTWTPLGFLLGGPSDAELVELLTHELTHCAMYQALGGEHTWTQRDVPLWFREGLASVSAGQGYRRVGPEAIWRYYRDAGSGDGQPAAGRTLRRARGLGDPLTDPESPMGEPLYQHDADLVYGTAHWAFRFLVDRYGEAAVPAILDGVRRGRSFEQAFRAAVGITPRELEDDFTRYVVLQGWRKGR